MSPNEKVRTEVRLHFASNHYNGLTQANWYGLSYKEILKQFSFLHKY